MEKVSQLFGENSAASPRKKKRRKEHHQQNFEDFGILAKTVNQYVAWTVPETHLQTNTNTQTKTNAKLRTGGGA